MWEAAKILLGVAGCVIGYGVVHDQVTVRICLSYFSVFHPDIGLAESPTSLALAWGVLATWWMAIPAGLAIAWATRGGPLPKLSTRRVMRVVGVGLGVLAVIATLAGVIGWMLASQGAMRVASPWAERIEAEQHDVFLACGAAHTASYFAGAALCIGLCILFRRERRRLGGQGGGRLSERGE